MEAKGLNFSQDTKRAAVELWKAKVPLKNIREQLQMNERTLRRVLAAYCMFLHQLWGGGR